MFVSKYGSKLIRKKVKVYCISFWGYLAYIDLKTDNKIFTKKKKKMIEKRMKIIKLFQLPRIHKGKKMV